MITHYRSGYVAIVGPPNVGKSTLLNHFLGQKIAIVSAKPQTTRNRILGILTRKNFQIVFLDTPGIFRPSYPLQKTMVQTATRALEESDVVLMMTDGTRAPGPDEDGLLKLLARGQTPVILAINKVDLIRDKRKILPLMARYHQSDRFQEIVPVSALTGDGCEDLLTGLVAHLAPGPQYYPGEMITESPELFMAAETIREKIFLRTGEEIPYAAAVKVDQYKDRGELLYIKATIYVERDSQKAMVIGERGGKLKEIGQMARAELEATVGKKVFLDLWVKVRRKWRHKKSDLRFFGYDGRR